MLQLFLIKFIAINIETWATCWTSARWILNVQCNILHIILYFHSRRSANVSFFFKLRYPNRFHNNQIQFMMRFLLRKKDNMLNEDIQHVHVLSQHCENRMAKNSRDILKLLVQIIPSTTSVRWTQITLQPNFAKKCQLPSINIRP